MHTRVWFRKKASIVDYLRYFNEKVLARPLTNILPTMYYTNESRSLKTYRIMAKAKTKKSEFKFRNTDRIGSASAEHDGDFLKDCFVETNEYQLLKDKKDNRQIVLGRTGSGKSALFERLKQEEDRVISIEPNELALTYISNSSIIQYLSDIGVNLDPFYKLLWRHVLTVEVLRKHFEPHINENENIWNFISEILRNPSRKERDAKQALEYLQQWGEKFWVETEYRVKEITTKMENKIDKEIKAGLGYEKLNISAVFGKDSSISDEQRTEVVKRSQIIVNESQVQDLGKVRSLLESILSDRQKYYYILIDRLDEDWVEEKIQYHLIMALLDSVKEIGQVSNIKILIAIRRDLIDRVFRLVRKRGFQEEKYQSLYLPLSWSSSQLIEILDRRIDKLVSRRYQKSQKVTHNDLLPKRIDGEPIAKFIYERAKRPRDIISFFNSCISEAGGKPKLVVDNVRRAEGEYSRQRLHALGDEWNADYPGLLDFVGILKKRSPSFSLSQVKDVQIEEFCLNSTINHINEPDYINGPGILREYAAKVSEARMDIDIFKQKLFMIFYKTGLVGLKTQSFESASWVDESGDKISFSEIDNNTSVTIHPTYRRALGIMNR